MKRINAALRHPLFPTAVAVWFVFIAWSRDWPSFWFAAGILTAMAINDWSDWWFKRWKERYHREQKQGGGT